MITLHSRNPSSWLELQFFDEPWAFDQPYRLESDGYDGFLRGSCYDEQITVPRDLLMTMAAADFDVPELHKDPITSTLNMLLTP